ncbi:AAA family ATPase [Paeniclostridium hominis]|uniref:AAA family ATPase n=1 Tax=Paeniclostridium hominis TaxID=2764329 RepID=UPI0022E7D101|nr:AAA family ATPase [Paeniclostridium hominis]
MEYNIKNESNEEKLSKYIYNILDNNDHIKKLKSDEEFYFEKAIIQWNEFINYKISNQELDEILDTVIKPIKVKNKKTTEIILEMNQESKTKHGFLNIICSIVAYVDSKAYRNKEFNEYEDKRAMASTFIWQDRWFKSLINYKKTNNINEVSGIVKSVITFLQYPEKKLSSFSSDKLKLFVEIFEPTINTNDYDILCEKVYKYFEKYKISVVNEKNRGLIYGHIIYLPEVRSLWDAVDNELEEGNVVEDIVVKYGEEEYNAQNNRYLKSDILEEVFINESKIDDILFNLDYKKNIIFQGPPGVGKTFVAKRLCYLHQQKKSKDNIETVQFHQSYSYEDFIRGYRPNKDGGFSLKDGVFYKFVQKAIKDQEDNYYFIIDEINRGNLSKIFGELMMLIEADKRGEEHQVSLTYQEDDEKFYIPENLYIIGTMNTADRSLAMVDYALRRRFAFIDLEPAFENETLVSHFSNYLGNEMTNKIINKITRLNNIIEKENIDLGKGYKIGHSYFTPNKEVNDVNSWYERIIKMEIEPLIREYWFDESEEELQKKVDDLLAD